MNVFCGVYVCECMCVPASVLITCKSNTKGLILCYNNLLAIAFVDCYRLVLGLVI